MNTSITMMNKMKNYNRFLFCAIVGLLVTCKAFSQSMDLQWQIGYHNTETEPPAQWHPATVPGAVQLDVMKAENYRQPWWYAENVHQFDWMEKAYFTYKTTFKKQDLKNGNRLFFFSKGIDYQFKIYLNNQQIWEQEGMFTYPSVIKPAYYHVANACRPVLASIRVPKFQWKEGDDFVCDLFLLNDTYEAIEKAVITVSLRYDGKEESLLRWDFDGTEAFLNKRGPTTHFRIPKMQSKMFSVKVQVEGKSEYDSVYTFLYVAKK